MKSILIVSSDPMENERIRAALTVQGWWVAEVADRESSMQAAADQAPDLVLVQGRLAGAREVAETFALKSGGPGVVLLGADDADWARLADQRLPSPVDTHRLVLVVKHLLDAPRPAPAGTPVSADVRLTASEIFAQVLHEVEYGAADDSEPQTASALFVAEGPASFVAEPVAAAVAAPPRPSRPPRQKASPPPERFGKYRLEERIAVGGMAEVWKARLTGVEGFEKTVAIKKILPHLGESGDFESMFVEEAKLAANLDHDHIVRINDLGKIDDRYFIAMEYVDGKDLRSILNAARKRGERVPLELSVLIATRLASALDYAHRRRDEDDVAAGIVHRDVSPRNVLVSYGGRVKLCDFGIAKAQSRVSHTRIGAIKGKLQFMSPEQAWGKPVDGRSDTFSLGVVLFELLTGKRLFAADNEISLLEVVRSCATREPRAEIPDLPEKLNDVVVRALREKPEERYQSAGEMQRDLEEILYSTRPAPGNEDLARYLGSLFTDVAPGSPSPPAAVPEPAAAAGAAGEADAGGMEQSLPMADPLDSASVEATGAAGVREATGAEETGPQAESRATESEETESELTEPGETEPEETEMDAAFAEVTVAHEATAQGRRKFLYRAAAALAIVGILALVVYLTVRSGADPAPVDPARATVDAAAVDAVAQPAAPPAEETSPEELAAGAPEADELAAPAPPVEEAADPPLADIVSRELARTEAELRRRFETEQEQLLQELDELAAGAAAGKDGADPPASAEDDGDGGD